MAGLPPAAPPDRCSQRSFGRSSHGRLLWQFHTDAARANRDWVLDATGRFNAGLLFASSWGDAAAEGARRQQGVGSFFSTPLVADGTVYIGSADASLYASE